MHYCGNAGCVESEISMSGFLRKYADVTNQSFDLNLDSWERFLAKVDSEDKDDIKVIKQNGKIMGKLISILVNIFEPVLQAHPSLCVRIVAWTATILTHRG